jgi:hypothetical protein
LIERHGRFAFRGLRCPAQRDDAVAEAVALAWRWFARLAARGQDPSAFPSALATFAARAVHDGRRVCGRESDKDALSPRARQRRGFAVGKLPDLGTLEGNPWQEALHDNTQTGPADQAAFRLDFPVWLRTRTERDRRVIADLMLGERTKDVGAKYGLSAGRISQLRRELCNDWRRFHGEPAGADA